MKCVSCGKETEDCVKFPCPECKKEISRCNKCRGLSIEFKCGCGYQGP